MNQTTHFGWKLPQLNDPVDITVLNSNFSAMDNTLYHTVYVSGSYSGDGQENRTISLGFTPHALLLINEGGRTSLNENGSEWIYGGLVLPDCPMVYSGRTYLEIVSGGFALHQHPNQSSCYGYLNSSGKNFYYMAWQ
ncbi:MAG: hypothetical protein ACOX7F_09460 [Eubacteriales bacterium]|jgi:hypothetical protein